MLIRNGKVLTGEGRFETVDVSVKDDRILGILPAGQGSDADTVDAAGCYLLPGFVDIHSHGAVGVDFCDADPAAVEKLLGYYGAQGITSVVPATMSYNEPIIADIMKAAAPYFDKDGYGAVLRGVNMEGPFINIEKKGAQNPQYIVDPQINFFRAVYEQSGGKILMVDIAPELPGSLDFIRAVSDTCVISFAHTSATYDEALAGFEAGANHVTHLFNAMPPFNHRDPGVVGAASDAGAYVEIISDGIHLHPAVVRAAFRWFGCGRVCLISDSMRATGMPNGEYDLGGQMVKMDDGKATLVDGGAIAGSAVNLAEMCRRAIGFGVPMEQAVCAASLTPAQSLGLDGEIGSIEKGKRADFVLWDQGLNTRAVIVGGKRL